LRGLLNKLVKENEPEENQ